MSMSHAGRKESCPQSTLYPSCGGHTGPLSLCSWACVCWELQGPAWTLRLYLFVLLWCSFLNQVLPSSVLCVLDRGCACGMALGRELWVSGTPAEGHGSDLPFLKATMYLGHAFIFSEAAL